MSAPLRWGVIGATSTVARQAVLPALRASPDATLVAVASRGRDAAGAVAAEFGAATAYGDYAAVLEDERVECVYVPLPNSMHREWTERAAAAGKHVLCEKPLAPSAVDARAMADACAHAGVVLMEAYMSPFHPRHDAVISLVRSGRCGALRTAHAVFSFALRGRDNHRWRAAMGGGALLDVGIYCLAPMLLAAGVEDGRVLSSVLAMSGDVDATAVAMLDLGGVTATAVCSFELAERQILVLAGTEGTVEVERPFTAGPADTSFRVRHLDGSVEARHSGGADPYRAMVDHVAAVVRAGASPRRRPADSIALLALIERVRDAAGASQRSARGIGASGG